jgi:uncharacterized repeat protein (TIGR04138 family)
MQHHAKLLDDLLRRDDRYPIQAYGCVLAALNDTIRRLPQPRHISGQELSHGFKCYAIDQFGPMANDVVSQWNLRSTEDIGIIVFNLIDVGLLSRDNDDRPEDFQAVYRFEDVFSQPYPYLEHYSQSSSS